MIRVWKSCTGKWAISIATFIALGYLSNAVSSEACKWRAKAFVDSHFGEPGVELNAMPSAMPWIVHVKVHWAGQDDHIYIHDFVYFNIFGISIPIQNAGKGR